MDPEVAEEQAMEMEALQAIYMEDIEVLGSSPHEFQIKLVPDGSDSLPGVILKVTFTPRYPKEAPQLEVTPLRNIDADSCASLRDQLDAEALQNLDMAMVLTLAQMAKGQLRMSRTIRILTEWLENIKDELARKAREREERARLQEYEEEQAQQIIQERKFQAGTPVNPTTFAEWKAKFELETKSSKLRTATEEEKRLSGRQLFEIDASLFAYDDIDEEELPEF
ncbi:RWD domain containing protein [Acanthamoeba castellanii str. Neff]|uniref:RWD domain containing protein n=1 Tax=Acanthamoeba castellanii (strain ATCC 30010 / Neff) TaxID=1257118 RepID=L8HB44_ACACF|nr:RWD domain containing protein [Acanthamoeba castellanii str. Neff]ELR21586.1 RWD domain containing protein [Acanthamoeba castellanii str. Neff]